MGNESLGPLHEAPPSPPDSHDNVIPLDNYRKHRIVEIEGVPFTYDERTGRLLRAVDTENGQSEKSDTPGNPSLAS